MVHRGKNLCACRQNDFMTNRFVREDGEAFADRRAPVFLIVLNAEGALIGDPEGDHRGVSGVAVKPSCGEGTPLSVKQANTRQCAHAKARSRNRAKCFADGEWGAAVRITSEVA
jgi:hypothetical protein